MAFPEPTVAQLLSSGRTTFSFEFFPPKTEQGVTNLWQAVGELAPLEPDFMSVTYGANGSRRDNSIAVTSRMAASDFRTVGHLTCVSQSRSHLEKMVDDYASVGVKHVLAVRGDMPGGPTVPWVRHPEGLSNATDLVKLVKSRGDFCVGVGAFPELHPEHHDSELDIRVLCEKQDAGAEFAITQLFFDSAKYFTLVEKANHAGCTMPIIPGLMPISNVSQLDKFADMAGAPLPKWMVDKVMAVSGDETSVKQVGHEIMAALAEELLKGGAPGIHIYTQNRAESALALVSQLKARGW